MGNNFSTHDAYRDEFLWLLTKTKDYDELLALLNDGYSSLVGFSDPEQEDIPKEIKKAKDKQYPESEPKSNLFSLQKKTEFKYHRRDLFKLFIPLIGAIANEAPLAVLLTIFQHGAPVNSFMWHLTKSMQLSKAQKMDRARGNAFPVYTEMLLNLSKLRFITPYTPSTYNNPWKKLEHYGQVSPTPSSALPLGNSSSSLLQSAPKTINEQTLSSPALLQWFSGHKALLDKLSLNQANTKPSTTDLFYPLMLTTTGLQMNCTHDRRSLKDVGTELLLASPIIAAFSRFPRGKAIITRYIEAEHDYNTLFTIPLSKQAITQVPKVREHYNNNLLHLFLTCGVDLWDTNLLPDRNMLKSLLALPKNPYHNHHYKAIPLPDDEGKIINNSSSPSGEKNQIQSNSPPNVPQSAPQSIFKGLLTSSSFKPSELAKPSTSGPLYVKTFDRTDSTSSEDDNIGANPSSLFPHKLLKHSLQSGAETHSSIIYIQKRDTNSLEESEGAVQQPYHQFLSSFSQSNLFLIQVYKDYRLTENNSHIGVISALLRHQNPLFIATLFTNPKRIPSKKIKEYSPFVFKNEWIKYCNFTAASRVSHILWYLLDTTCPDPMDDTQFSPLSRQCRPLQATSSAPTLTSQQSTIPTTLSIFEQNVSYILTNSNIDYTVLNHNGETVLHRAILRGWSPYLIHLIYTQIAIQTANLLINQAPINFTPLMPTIREQSGEPITLLRSLSSAAFSASQSLPTSTSNIGTTTNLGNVDSFYNYHIVNHPDHFGRTPLHLLFCSPITISRYRSIILEMLLSPYLNPTIVDFNVNYQNFVGLQLTQSEAYYQVLTRLELDDPYFEPDGKLLQAAFPLTHSDVYDDLSNRWHEEAQAAVIYDGLMRLEGKRKEVKEIQKKNPIPPFVLMKSFVPYFNTIPIPRHVTGVSLVTTKLIKLYCDQHLVYLLKTYRAHSLLQHDDYNDQDQLLITQKQILPPDILPSRINTDSFITHQFIDHSSYSPPSSKTTATSFNLHDSMDFLRQTSRQSRTLIKAFPTNNLIEPRPIPQGEYEDHTYLRNFRQVNDITQLARGHKHACTPSPQLETRGVSPVPTQTALNTSPVSIQVALSSSTAVHVQRLNFDSVPTVSPQFSTKTSICSNHPASPTLGSPLRHERSLELSCPVSAPFSPLAPPLCETPSILSFAPPDQPPPLPPPSSPVFTGSSSISSPPIQPSFAPPPPPIDDMFSLDPFQRQSGNGSPLFAHSETPMMQPESLTLRSATKHAKRSDAVHRLSILNDRLEPVAVSNHLQSLFLGTGDCSSSNGGSSGDDDTIIPTSHPAITQMSKKTADNSMNTRSCDHDSLCSSLQKEQKIANNLSCNLQPPHTSLHSSANSFDDGGDDFYDESSPAVRTYAFNRPTGHHPTSNSCSPPFKLKEVNANLKLAGPHSNITHQYQDEFEGDEVTSVSMSSATSAFTVGSPRLVPGKSTLLSLPGLPKATRNPPESGSEVDFSALLLTREDVVSTLHNSVQQDLQHNVQILNVLATPRIPSSGMSSPPQTDQLHHQPHLLPAPSIDDEVFKLNKKASTPRPSCRMRGGVLFGSVLDSIPPSLTPQIPLFDLPSIPPPPPPNSDSNPFHPQPPQDDPPPPPPENSSIICQHRKNPQFTLAPLPSLLHPAENLDLSANQRPLSRKSSNTSNGPRTPVNTAINSHGSSSMRIMPTSMPPVNIPDNHSPALTSTSHTTSESRSTRLLPLPAPSIQNLPSIDSSNSDDCSSPVISSIQRGRTASSQFQHGYIDSISDEEIPPPQLLLNCEDHLPPLPDTLENKSNNNNNQNYKQSRLQRISSPEFLHKSISHLAPPTVLAPQIPPQLPPRPAKKQPALAVKPVSVPAQPPPLYPFNPPTLSAQNTLPPPLSHRPSISEKRESILLHNALLPRHDQQDEFDYQDAILTQMINYYRTKLHGYNNMTIFHYFFRAHIDMILCPENNHNRPIPCDIIEKQQQYQNNRRDQLFHDQDGGHVMDHTILILLQQLFLKYFHQANNAVNEKTHANPVLRKATIFTGNAPEKTPFYKVRDYYHFTIEDYWALFFGNSIYTPNF